MGVFRVRTTRRAPAGVLAPVVLAALFAAAPARGEDAAQWLARVAKAARQNSYVGTIVYQRGNRVETSRLVHLNADGKEYEKLVSLDGPAREVVRSQGEVRMYFPDAKLVRVEPRTFRNAFPSLSPEQQKSLKKYYEFKTLPPERIGGVEADVVVFEPKDDLRYGQRFWSDKATGLLLKARVVDERGQVLQQFLFSDVQINAKIDKSMTDPTWPAVPPDWTVKELSVGDVTPHETGWVVTRVPQGFTKIIEGYRKMRNRKDPVAHLVFSDGLVAISVFIGPYAEAPAPIGMQQPQAGFNVFNVKQDDNLITVMGEAPGPTVRQIANSVVRR